MNWKLFWQIALLMIIGALLLLLVNTVMISITMSPFSQHKKYLWDKKVPRMEMPRDIPLER